MSPKRLAAIVASVVLPLAMQVPASAQSGPLVIGVDHLDLANQQFALGRAFSYTDFFSRDVTVHTGDSLHFHGAATFHVIALASNAADARTSFPLFLSDTDDPAAPGSGTSKLRFGPAGFAAFAPPSCGLSLSTACDFTGANIPITPLPGGADWFVQVNAAPGTYNYFCYIHPGMQGTLNVVGPNIPTTTQDQIDAKSFGQFISDRAEALDVEAADNIVSFTGGDPGTRTYQVHVGASAANDHVAILEMMPGSLSLTPGDSVQYLWSDPHEAHSVTFPASADVPDFAPEFEPGEVPPFEIVADPGNAASGTLLTSPATLVDSGVLIGTAYGVPSSQSWSAATGGGTASGAYTFHCVIHDFMVGTLRVGS
jgi:plastocyanin